MSCHSNPPGMRLNSDLLCWLITTQSKRSIPNNKKSAARGGSARTNALAIDLERLVSNALNKQNQQKSTKRRKKGRSRIRSNTLNLHQGQSSNMIPTQFFSTSPGSTPGGSRIRGRELASIASAKVNGGFAVFPVILRPETLQRLSVYRSIYEMYVFHSAKVIFQSNQPTTSSGVFAMAVDYDSTDTQPGDMAEMMRNISSSMSNIYSDSVTLVDKRLSRYPRYFTNDNDTPECTQAIIYIASEGFTSPVEGPTQIPVGYIFIEYDIEFFTPQ